MDVFEKPTFSDLYIFFFYNWVHANILHTLTFILVFDWSVHLKNQWSYDNLNIAKL